MKNEQSISNSEKATQLFLHHYLFVRYIAIIHAPNKSFQEDIVNDAFVDFVKKADQWDLESDVRPLLRKITENIALQYWKKWTQVLPEPLLQIAEIVQKNAQQREIFSHNHEMHDELKAMQHCIEKLSPQSRELVDRHYFDDVSLTDLARDSGQNVNTLYYRIAKIRSFLRNCVERLLKSEELDG